jgi:hypothetical protein
MSKTIKKKEKHHKKPDPFIRAIVNMSIILASTTLTMFVIVNMMASQMVPSLFERIAHGEENAIISFYAISRGNGLRYEMFDHVATDEAMYADDLSSAHRNRQELIVYYESLLQSNPNARDVLYALSILYNQEENTAQADYYMSQARMIDPGIGM